MFPRPDKALVGFVFRKRNEKINKFRTKEELLKKHRALQSKLILMSDCKKDLQTLLKN